MQGGTYRYVLDAVDVFGRTERHGPVEVTVPTEQVFGCGTDGDAGAAALAVLLAAGGILFGVRKRSRCHP